MKIPIPRGTLLNTATVAVGSAIGMLIGKNLDDRYKAIAIGGLGLVTLGIGLKLFLQSRNVIIVAISIALGGMLGLALGIDVGIAAFAEWAREVFGGSKTDPFTEGLIAAFILF